MHYISTRGDAPHLSFADALLAGLARDGGLYLPQSYPKIDIHGLSGKNYSEIAQTVLTPFVGETFDKPIFKAMIEGAYATFRHEAVTPLVQISANEWILELFHGPTLAFKDLAMQLLGRMMDHVLQSRNQRATIIGATSGDTGGAAIEAFRGLKNVDMFILFPDGRVSDVQRRMMTTVNDPNVHAIAVDGSFDDCQAMIKALFNNHSFRDEVQLSGVNSINWARIAAQIVYYFTAGAALGLRPTRYIVPTGNFGDIFAGYVAKQMGLPVAELTIATNENDILHRTLQTGVYEVTGVHATSSPSMDIQVSSNFERLLFEKTGRDAKAIKTMMDNLKQSNQFTIPNNAMAHMRQDFTSSRASERDVQGVMQNVLAKSGYLLDPHTACGVVASRHMPRNDVPHVILSTAHPAKFPDIVKKYTGVDAPLPPSMGNLMTRKENFALLKADPKAFENYILKNIPSL